MTKSTKNKLDAKAIRKVAMHVPGCREVPTDEPTAVSFMTGLDNDPENKAGPARVNVYIDTGTIATCRVLNGQVRQVFRRNVTSLEAVERLLQDPAKLTSIEDGLVGEPTPLSDDMGTQALRVKMELAEVGICILMGEKERIEAHLESLAKQDTDSEADIDMAGIEFEFSLPEDAMKNVECCLQDIHKQEKPVTCVATSGRGTIFLYGNGGVAFTPNIPKALYHKLKQMKDGAASFGSRPCYVALGNKERYYVGFNDGTADWKGPKAFDKCIRKLTINASREKHGKREAKRHSKPRSVAFGSSFDSYFVVFHDGSWEFNGRHVPHELTDKLADRANRADLVCVTLGPKGEWFMKAENGRMVSLSLFTDFAFLSKVGVKIANSCI